MQYTHFKMTSRYFHACLLFLFSSFWQIIATNNSHGLEEVHLLSRRSQSGHRKSSPSGRTSNLYQTTLKQPGLSSLCSVEDGECFNTKREKLRSKDPEYRLYSYLFCKYNKEIRPVLNKSQPVKVTIDFAYNQLVDMSEKEQQLTSSIWFRQNWKDPWLSWNESEFGGIRYITVDPRFLWLPDIVLHNNVDKDKNGEMYKLTAKAKITSDGSIHWPSPVVTKSECKIDIKYFPFDDQKCILIFGSWIYDGNALDLGIKSTNADMSIYTENGEWSLISIHGKTVLHYYECCDTPYYYVKYTVHIRRRIRYYLSNLIFPCILLVTLSAFAFKFPTPCGERASLQITILLGMTVYMLIFTESIPPTSEATPLIGIYFMGLIVLMTSAILATCLSLRMYHNETKTDLPMWMRLVFFKFLAVIFRMKAPVQEHHEHHVRSPNTNKTVIVAEINSTERSPKIKTELNPITQNGRETENKQNIPLLEQEIKLPSNTKNNHTHISFWDDMKNDEKVGVNDFSNSPKQKKDDSLIEKEWRFVSIVIDKFFFWMFLISIVVFTTGIALTIPSHFSDFI